MSEYLEQIAHVYSFICCFGPVPAFIDAIRTKNLNQLSIYNLVLTSAMNYSWVLYGIDAENEVLRSVSFNYSLIFGIYALGAIFLKKEYGKCLFFLAAMAVTHVILAIFLPSEYLGYACTLAQFISDSSQWESIIWSLKKRNSSYFNINQLWISGVSCTLWTMIGFKHSDPFLIFPNGYNTLLHIFQIILSLSLPKLVTSEKKKIF